MTRRAAGTLLARALVLAALGALAACTTSRGPAPGPGPAAPASLPAQSLALSPLPETEHPPAESREFRAAWVATVAHIDWPSAPGLTAAALQAEATAILDRAQALGLNALVLQVRPTGDAIYPSALEPWTEYLSGTQGRPPWAEGEAPWDPLAFWLREARARGLELHAWFNPYRARHSSAKSAPVPPHLAAVRPDLVRRYGDMLWMDPAEPEAAAHTLAVVADLLRRYDVDGVHIDDYFYPYPVAPPGTPAPAPGTAPAAELPFPDDAPWARYLAGGGTLSREDWRRDHVDRLVQALYRTAQATRPGVRVGISPFGLPRPDLRPPGITGFSQYDKLYADVEKWFAAGWLDYLAPQLYWPIDRTAQAFPVLLDSWVGLNSAGRHLWPGLFTSLTTRGEPLGPRSWPAREVLEQVAVVRQRAPEAPASAGANPGANPGASGHIHFSMVALMQDRDGLATALQRGPYDTPALVPATPWLGVPAPLPPVLVLDGAAAMLRIEPAPGEPAARWAVWRRIEGAWRFTVLPEAAREVPLQGADAVVVSAIGRTGLASARNAVRVGP